MYLKVFINSVLVIILAVLQMVLAGVIPGISNYFNLSLVALIFLLATNGINLTIGWALGLGLFFDMFSFLPFGSYMLSFVATIWLIDFMLSDLFTDRSLYSFLAIGFVGTVFYEIMLVSSSHILNIVAGGQLSSSFSLMFWRAEAVKIIFNLIGTFLMFYAVNYITNKLKPVFLHK